MSNSESIYTLDGIVPLKKAIPFGLQHILAMFVSNVTPIIILAGICAGDLTAVLIQNAMIIAGIGTIVQLYPVWRVGSRLPIVMGISFTFLSLAIAIGTAQGMGTLMGAVIIGGIVEGLLGLFAKYWIRIISPVVAATVVTAIGFSLLPIGANSFAGGQGAADFGAAHNWIVGSVTLLACVSFHVFAKGYLRSLAVLMGLIVGYVLALCMGMIDFSPLKGCSIIAIPKFLPFSPEFRLGPTLSVIAIFLVSATETIGDTSALASSALGRNATEKEISGSIACDGFVSTIAGLFGCTPITSFSQNVGLAAMTKVVNRFAIATGAIIMIIAGLFPAVGVILTTIPQAVLGGCTIMMFGSILFAGFNMLSKCGFGSRNMVIVSLSLSIGLGFTQATGLFDIFPEIIKTVFADNCVAVVFLLAVLLNLILPKEKPQTKES
ncbi:MAG: nucleobase:cation symporter-2 family protein [Bacteroidales bacterium]|nr:nucleobase:cation symporter-2 family protein [Bacteroidales bacterium]